MWKDSIRNIVAIFQTTILRFVGFYVRRLATNLKYVCLIAPLHNSFIVGNCENALLCAFAIAVSALLAFGMINSLPVSIPFFPNI